MQDDETILHLCLLFLRGKDAVAWKEIHGGKVEEVSKTNGKAMKVQEVRFTCLGGAKLALEKMAKQENKYGDKNENPSHNNVNGRPLENVVQVAST